MKNKKKIKKFLDKRCPDCNRRMYIVEKSIVQNGVEYSDDYEECDCGYSEKLRVSPKKYKEIFNPHW